MAAVSIKITLFSLVGAVLYYVYFGYMDSKEGSFGKRLMKIRVLNKEGKTPSFGVALARQILLAIPLFDIISFVMILSREDRKGLHDNICSTTVVKYNS
jgi:uncharacterized RDD family membrane protein YckC